MTNSNKTESTGNKIRTKYTKLELYFKKIWIYIENLHPGCNKLNTVQILFASRATCLANEALRRIYKISLSSNLVNYQRFPKEPRCLKKKKKRLDDRANSTIHSRTYSQTYAIGDSYAACMHVHTVMRVCYLGCRVWQPTADRGVVGTRTAEELGPGGTGVHIKVPRSIGTILFGDRHWSTDSRSQQLRPCRDFFFFFFDSSESSQFRYFVRPDETAVTHTSRHGHTRAESPRERVARKMPTCTCENRVVDEESHVCQLKLPVGDTEEEMQEYDHAVRYAWFSPFHFILSVYYTLSLCLLYSFVYTWFADVKVEDLPL